MSDDDGMFLMNAASCGTCNQTGVVRTPEVMTRACPECVANGMPDPFKRAERQVAAVREVLAEYIEMINMGEHATPSEFVGMVNCIRAALETA